ncbi:MULTISPECIES: putative leader peptide [unclassified Blastococcus]
MDLTGNASSRWVDAVPPAPALYRRSAVDLLRVASALCPAA